MGSFLQEIFRRFGGAFRDWDGEVEATPSTCSGTLTQAVEHLVDETYRRLRYLPGYAARLRKPVAMTFRYIDELVETVPGAMLCSRPRYAEDPRVNAYFADPRHLQEVFSKSEEVRDLFEANPGVDVCWALLCMKKQERQKLGMSLVGDLVQKEVLQTQVSFIDHQVLSPASSEGESRRSLKCCIFNGMLAHIRKRLSDEKIGVVDLQTRRRELASRLKRAVHATDSEAKGLLQRELDAIRRELEEKIPRLASLEAHLDIVADVLGSPAQYVTGQLTSVRLSRLGIKLEDDRSGAGNAIPLFEIHIASQGTRVGVLASFPRDELLPRQGFARQADPFLSL